MQHMKPYETSSKTEGYTGTGYVAMDRNKGRKSVTWDYHAPRTGRYILEFRYINSWNRETPLVVTVNAEDAGYVMLWDTGTRKHLGMGPIDRGSERREKLHQCPSRWPHHDGSCECALCGASRLMLCRSCRFNSSVFASCAIRTPRLTVTMSPKILSLATLNCSRLDISERG